MSLESNIESLATRVGTELNTHNSRILDLEQRSPGEVESATKLTTARTIRTNLESTSTASFDGSADVSPGVTGTLPLANGGTGNTTGTATDSTKWNGASKTVSSGSPSGGSNGDVWLMYV